VASDFVSQSVRLLEEHPEAWIVGGPIVHGATGLRGRAVAIAMSHPFGVGTARHRFAGFEGYADTVQFPAFRRWVFERVGLFDTALVRNQDDEFNYRVVRAGGRIFISPAVRYVYYVRDKLTNLFRQYFQYSFWRVPVIRKHKKPTTVRQMVPLLFFLATFALCAAGFLLRQPLLALALPGVYALAMLLLGLSVVPRAGLRVATLVPVAVVIMHAAYALGMACGLSAALSRVRAWERKGAMSSLSR
jgi:GT2 family glycosyltransferase